MRIRTRKKQDVELGGFMDLLSVTKLDVEAAEKNQRVRRALADLTSMFHELVEAEPDIRAYRFQDREGNTLDIHLVD